MDAASSVPFVSRILLVFLCERNFLAAKKDDVFFPILSSKKSGNAAAANELRRAGQILFRLQAGERASWQLT
jgi:hypothetical protein